MTTILTNRYLALKKTLRRETEKRDGGGLLTLSVPTVIVMAFESPRGTMVVIMDDCSSGNQKLLLISAAAELPNNK